MIAAMWWGACFQADVDPLAQERQIIHLTEQQTYHRLANQALGAGDEAKAAAAIAFGFELEPVAFSAYVERLADVHDPQAAAILADRVDAKRFRALADRLALSARYGPRRADTLRQLEGVTRALGVRILSGVTDTYVVEPDQARMAAAAAAVLGELAHIPDAPELFGAYRPPELVLGDTVLSVVDRAVEQGLPEAVAVAEGVTAALAALDPYTRPVWPSSLAGWEEHHAGAYVGVGLSLGDQAGGVVVEEVAVDGPAWQGGLKIGDRIRAIDGPVDGLDSALAATRLRGDPGSAATVDFERDGKKQLVALVRAAIQEATVFGFRRQASGVELQVAPGVLYVRIASFRPHTDEAFDALLGEASANAFVLDLRGNGGGDVMAAVNVADRFIAAGPLAHLAGRTIPPPQAGPQGELPWNAAVAGHRLEGVPTVVLVDRDTASAAELVAGALQEVAGAKLVGETTFGKGLSQALRLDEVVGVGWQVTDGAWLLPSRRALEGPYGQAVGLLPDREVVLSPAERLQVDAMAADRERPTHYPDGTLFPAPAVSVGGVPQLTEDPQLVAALALLREAAGAP